MTAHPTDLRECECLDTRGVHLNQDCFRSSQVNPYDQARVELRTQDSRDMPIHRDICRGLCAAC